MSGFHVGWLDLIVVAVVIASAILAAYRGFVRESLAVFSWLAAAFVTLYFGRYAVPLMRDHFSPLVAEILAYSIVFLLVLLPLSFISHRISQNVKNSSVGTLDGSLGAAFGILRGLAVIAIAYILFSLVVPVKAQPLWIKNAELLPMVQGSAEVLLSLIPEEHADYLRAHTEGTAAAQNAAPAPDVKPRPSPAEKHHSTRLAKAKKPHRKGYGADERRALDRLFEATGNNGGHR
jgi:membrane protein required for colicin V production